jgi:DNA-binding transcriptional MerR regulator
MAENEKLSIGKMAELNRVTTETLRHYDRVGVLKPEYVDPDSGYRYYHLKQCAKLDMNQYLQSLGLSLETIKTQFENKDLRLTKSTLLLRQKQIDQEIRDLRQMDNAISTCIANYERYFAIPEFGRIVAERIGSRKVFVYDGKQNAYDNNLDAYEYILRKLRQQISVKHLPLCYFCNIGTITRLRDLDLNNLSATELFLFVDDHFDSDDGIETIPAQEYLCVYFSDYHDEYEYARMLDRFIKEHKYTICGDYLCEVITELPTSDQGKTRHLIIRIQVPIKKP